MCFYTCCFMCVWFYIPVKYCTKARARGNAFAGFGFSTLPSMCKSKISLDWFASLNNGPNLFNQGGLQHLEMTHPACNMYQLKPNSVLQPRMYIWNLMNLAFFFFLPLSQPKGSLLKKLITSRISISCVIIQTHHTHKEESWSCCENAF